MSYIGRKPTVGNFQICDAISVVNGQAAYTMQVGSVNVIPQSANHMIVSLNGTIQKPNSSFTVSGSTITFASNLATGDVIDFIQILGDVLDLGVPSDGTVTTAKLADSSVSLAKLTATGTKSSSTFLRGDNTFASAGGGLQSIQTFTSSGTYTKPSGINKIKVYITGGGGGGGSSNASATNQSGGGGASGGTAIELIDATSITTVTVTIGAGGTAGQSGGSVGGHGGTSSFGSYCSATGGDGGRYPSSLAGLISAGVGTNGDINLKGNAGQGGNENTASQAGNAGGGSFWGGAGYGRYNDTSESGVLGGGGGGANTASSYEQSGGAGGSGFCLVEEYK